MADRPAGVRVFSVASAIQIPEPSRVLPPQGWWEYALVGLAIGIALFALGWFVLGFFRPGEDAPDHIKYSILAEDHEGRSGDDGCSDQA